MIKYILIVIFFSLISSGITFLLCYLLPQKKIQQLNLETIQEEKQCLKKLHEEKNNIEKHIDFLYKEQNLLKDNIFKLEEQAKESAKIFYNQQLEIAQEKLERSLEHLGQEYQANEEEFKKKYLQMMEECVDEYQKMLSINQENYTKSQNELIDLQKKVEVAVQAAKRREAERTERDFYRLILSDTDLKEIQCLREVEPFLRDKEALNKVIWKVYYEKPTSDLIGRVIGSGIHTGIYKITEISTEKCYVGQAVNIADRFKQHIKRGIGAEPPTRNKLYPAMNASGPENFMFEIIEECSRTLLDEREKYWTDYFKAQEFGFSIRKG